MNKKRPILEVIFKPTHKSKMTQFEIFYEDIPHLIRFLEKANWELNGKDKKVG